MVMCLQVSTRHCHYSDLATNYVSVHRDTARLVVRLSLEFCTRTVVYDLSRLGGGPGRCVAVGAAADTSQMWTMCETATTSM